MMYSPGEDAPSTFTRALARSRSTATSIQRSPPLSTLKMSNGGNIASLWLLQTFDSEIEPQGQAPVYPRSKAHRLCPECLYGTRRLQCPELHRTFSVPYFILLSILEA